jgi:site-specific DNA-methyltransferase (adenine-specific)
MEQKLNSNTEAGLNNVQPHLNKTTCCVQPFSFRKDAVSELYNMDCVQGLKHYPNKYFGLAICDPPYGINVNMNMGVRKGEKRKHQSKDWDKETPNNEYFKELFRVSKNQIIWGANNFIDNLTNKTGWIFWDKEITGDVPFSSGELAWTSYDCALKKVSIPIQSNYLIEKRIHPTQKPTRLYNWILDNYAAKGMRILDTHVGSGSSRIACYLNGFDFVGFEIDKQYCEASEKRFVNAISQQRLFT